jgi:hypothetical protein
VLHGQSGSFNDGFHLGKALPNLGYRLPRNSVLSILRTLTRNIEKIAGKDTWAGGLARLGLPPQGQLRSNPHYAGQEGGARQGGKNSHGINLYGKGTWD